MHSQEHFSTGIFGSGTQRDPLQVRGSICTSVTSAEQLTQVELLHESESLRDGEGKASVCELRQCVWES